jgi:hypothetical protein
MVISHLIRFHPLFANLPRGERASVPLRQPDHRLALDGDLLAGMTAAPECRPQGEAGVAVEAVESPARPRHVRLLTG